MTSKYLTASSVVRIIGNSSLSIRATLFQWTPSSSPSSFCVMPNSALARFSSTPVMLSNAYMNNDSVSRDLSRGEIFLNPEGGEPEDLRPQLASKRKFLSVAIEPIFRDG